MSTVIDTITADTVEPGDVVEYVLGKGPRRGQTRTLSVKSVEDTGSVIYITGVPDDIPGNETITVPFSSDDYVDIIGS